MSLASSLFSQTVSAVSANRPEKVVSTVESLLQSGLCMLAMPFLTLSAALAALSVPSIGEIEYVNRSGVLSFGSTLCCKG